jgi:hypothetical protein
LSGCHAAPVGIITLEDVLEELMQAGVVVSWCVVACFGSAADFAG